MAWYDPFLQPLINLWDRIFGGTVIGKLANKFIDGAREITTLFSRIEALFASIASEVSAFKNWKEDIRFKSRVINVPKAAEQLSDLVSGLSAAYRSIVDIGTRLRDLVQSGGNPEAEAEELATDLGEAGNVGESLLRRLPKLSQALEKVLGVVTLFVDAIVNISSAVDDLQTIVDEVARIRELVESGETIFLSQKNPRRTEQLAGGGSINIRVGNLHPS